MTSAANVREEIEKAASLVTTARRLFATGTMVDLSALDGRVRFVCATLEGMERELGRPMIPAMEALIADLDLLAEAIRERLYLAAPAAD